MLLEGPTAAELEAYVERELIPITQAEPKSLAKYVMALLKKDRSLSSLESLCNRQLQEFLGDATSGFVRALFKKLRSMQPAEREEESYGGRRSASGSDDVAIELPLKRSQSTGRGDDDEPKRRRREDPGRGRDRDRDRDTGRGDVGRHDGRGRANERGGRNRGTERGGDRGGDRWGPGPSGGPPGHPPPQGPPFGAPPGPPGQQMPPHQQRHAQGGPRGGNGRGGGLHPAEDHRKTSTTLHITNVPRELNTIIQLVEHFKKFGSVVNIQVRQDQDRAFVQFSTRQEAMNAIRSPEAVLGNRFIRVYWSKGDGSAPLGAPARGYAVPDSDTSQGAREESNGPHGRPQGGPPQPSQAELPDRRQLSFERNPSQAPVPRAPPAASASASAAAAKLQSQLREKLIGQQKDIMLLLTKKKDSLDEATKATLKAQLGSINEQLTKVLQSSAKAPGHHSVVAPPPPKSPAAVAPSAPEGEMSASAAKLAALREKLAAVQQEAQAQGVDPAAAYSSAPARGGRGRGRGGRGGYAPAWRGRGRGRGGRGGVADRGARKLDNRPTAIAVADLPEELQSIDAFKEKFPAASEADVSVEDGTVIANFRNRQLAEQVMNTGLSGPDGDSLELSWHRPPAPEPTAVEPAQTTVSVYQPHAGDADAEGEEGAPPKAEAYCAIGDDLDADDDDEEKERSWKR